MAVGIPDDIRKGVTILLSCSGVSLLATSTLLGALGYRVIKDRFFAPTGFGRRRTTLPQGSFWLINLFVADWVQSLGSLLSTHWLVINEITPGPYCNLQSIGLNSGDLGSAMWTFVVAITTFLSIAGGPNHRDWIARKSSSGKARWLVVVGIWTFIIFVGVYGLVFIQPFHPEDGPYYSSTGVGWCWVGKQFFWARILSFYIFVFLDMFGLIILYGVLFFYIRIQLRSLHTVASTSDREAQFPTSDVTTTKTVTVTSEESRSRHSRVTLRVNPAQQRMNQASRTLLLYPVVYVVIMMPLSITRLMQFANKDPSLRATYIACAMFDCQGLVNAILYTCTRKGIIPWDVILQKFKRNPTSRGSDHSTDISRTVVPISSMGTLNQSKFRSENSDSASYVNIPPRFGTATSEDDKCIHEQISTDSLGEKDIFNDGNTNSGTCNCGRGDKKT